MSGTSQGEEIQGFFVWQAPYMKLIGWFVCLQQSELNEEEFDNCSLFQSSSKVAVTEFMTYSSAGLV